MTRRKVACVVAAAGRGERSGLGYNKVFYNLDGRSVISRTLDALSQSGLIDEIALVLADGDMAAYDEIARREGVNPLVKAIARGGETRQMSVMNGLKALSEDTTIALVHDGARPFVSREMIAAVIEDAEKYGSGVISSPVTDTVKVTDAEGFAVDTPDRARLRSVQTPQGFRYSEILEAYEFAEREGIAATDDAQLYERRFSRVKLTWVPGAEKNIKLTNPSDFEAKAPRAVVPRVGTGYDVHRLVEERELVLCGVKIPFEKGLLGHSDADVALHALMDAMLGAAALGDIGHLFPDSDERYRGISSVKLLAQTARALREAGYAVSSCDVTIVCQRPKLAPFIGRMRGNIASTLEIPVSSVSVKATTTEKLGFEGEGAGISAQSVAVVVPV